MAELIDRQALGIGRCNPDVFPLQNRGYCAGWNGVINLIEQAPTVDAVEVVRCKGCLFYNETIGKDSGKPCGYGSCRVPGHITGIVYDEDFCSYGERKDNGC